MGGWRIEIADCTVDCRIWIRIIPSFAIKNRDHHFMNKCMLSASRCIPPSPKSTKLLSCPISPIPIPYADNKVMKYYGSTELQFLKRYNKHKSSFKIRPQGHTTLSLYIWKLKDKQIKYEIKWSIKARGHAFSSGSRACDLCLTEKLVILTTDQNSMLNKRDELLETCRRQRKHLLVSLIEENKPPDTTVK